MPRFDWNNLLSIQHPAVGDRPSDAECRILETARRRGEELEQQVKDLTKLQTHSRPAMPMLEVWIEGVGNRRYIIAASNPTVRMELSRHSSVDKQWIAFLREVLGSDAIGGVL